MEKKKKKLKVANHSGFHLNIQDGSYPLKLGSSIESSGLLQFLALTSVLYYSYEDQ